MLCVTGIEKNCRALARRLEKNASSPLQEVRCDALAEMPEGKGFPPIDPRKIIAACRRVKDYGLFKGPEEKRIALLERACRLGVGWVDVEADLPETSFKRIQASARASRTRILRSLHLGAGAGANEIHGAFTLLNRSPGDAVKLAAPFDDVADLRVLFEAPRDRPFVIVGMGPAGIVSRILYNRFGAAWTYIAADRATAPLPEMPDIATASLCAMPVDPKAPLFVLLGGPSIAGSPGFAVYNRLFRKNSYQGCYLPAVTGRLKEAFLVLERLGLAGASVTIPHKLAAAGLAEILDDGARHTRAVNTLYLKEGEWHGANTDVAAVSVLAARMGTRPGQKALILGTGGFARAGAWALADLGANVILLGRSLIEDVGPWEDCLPIEALGKIPFHIFLNATPLGANGNGRNVFSGKIDFQGKIVIDGVLGPQASLLVRRAVKASARVCSGVDIWAEQGARQLALFGYPGASPSELKELAVKWGGIADTPKPDQGPREKEKRDGGKGEKKKPGKSKRPGGTKGAARPGRRKAGAKARGKV